MQTTKTGLPLFPWTVGTSILYQAEVVSAADERGVRQIIYQGNKVTAEFVAVAANRMSKARKGI